MDVALAPRPELLDAVRRQVRAPWGLLVVLGSFLGLSALYIGWFGSRWGLLLLIPALGLVLAAVALAARVRRGRTALATDRPFLRIAEDGVETADGEHLAWPAIDRIDLVRAPGTPLDALPDGARATVMNAGGTRGTWQVTLREGGTRTGRFDLVPTPEYHALLIAGRDLARDRGGILLDRQDAP